MASPTPACQGGAGDSVQGRESGAEPQSEAEAEEAGPAKASGSHPPPHPSPPPRPFPAVPTLLGSTYLG